MQIRDIMTAGVKTISPNASIQSAAEAMATLEIGLLPVGDNDRLVGMISDRDLVVRGLCEGVGPEARVGDVMSREVMYCYDDQPTDEVCANMAELQVRRLPVVNRDKRLVGIVSLGDLSRLGAAAEETLAKISQPGGQHSH